MIFGKNGKPIALLLAKNGCFLALFDLSWELKKVEIGGFLAKIEAYSLTFWLKMGFFGYFLFPLGAKER